MSFFTYIGVTNDNTDTLRQQRDEIVNNAIKADNAQASVDDLLVAISKLSHELALTTTRIDDLIVRQATANRLIALNMFAIVRLELGTSVDKIINDALYIKRLHTGSGNARAAAECATAIALMAGNILSAGGLSAVGQIVNGSATALNALVHEKPKSIAIGVTSMAAGITDSVNPGTSSDNAQLSKNTQLQSSTSTSQQNALITNMQQSASASYNAVYDAATRYLDNIPADKTTFKYIPKRRTTAYISHGAGGTEAITFDVKKHIEIAYGDMIKQLHGELTIPPLDSTNQPIVKELSEYDPSKSKSCFHPLTQIVLKQALLTLSSRMTQFNALTGKSGTFYDQAGYAKNGVTEFYNNAHSKLIAEGHIEVDPKWFTSNEQRSKENLKKESIL
jgi:hypothetical protein